MTEPRDRSTVVLVVCGSIAAYKAPLVARLLLKQGLRVVPVMTRAAREFLGPATLSGLTGERVHSDAFEPGLAGELHIELGRSARVIAVVPATADLMARLAAGRADDLAAATCLSSDAPIVLAPAMHPRMWAQASTRRNVDVLTRDGRATFVGPVDGEVASFESGVGRMAEPEAIAETILRTLRTQNDLAGKHVVISAGPSVEDIDPVRFIGNRSTGKMGFAVAQRARARGARVTLVCGPVALATPAGVARVDTRGALAMQAALDRALADGADALVMTAAVGDYRPAQVSPTKLKRDGQAITLELIPNPDLLAEIGKRRSGAHPVLVGFAVETANPAELIVLARKKLEAKRVDLVVANHAADSFGRDDNTATLVSATDAVAHPAMAKIDLADRILDYVRDRLASATPQPA